MPERDAFLIYLFILNNALKICLMEMYISITILYIYVYIYIHILHCLPAITHSNISIQGRKEMFYLTTHSTHFIYGYMASDIWLRTTQIARGNPLPPHWLLLPISSKGSFICTIPQTGYINTRSWLSTNLQSFRCVQDSFHLLRSMWAKFTKNVFNNTDLTHYNS